MTADRIPDGRWRSALEAVRAILGPFSWLIDETRWVCGADPLFIGLHRFATITDGRSYRDTAHACYPHHLDGASAPTVVLPLPVAPAVIVHELGHVLDWRIGAAHTAHPIDAYAALNRREAFAEAFRVHLDAPLPWTVGDHHTAHRDTVAADPSTLSLFEELAA
jgi:hypothetical protein